MKRSITILITFLLFFSVHTALAAIDSEDKRRAIMNIMPVPDGTISNTDRRHIAGFFPTRGADVNITVCSSGCTSTSISGLGVLIPGDIVSLVGEVLTEDVNTSNSGSVGNVITIRNGTIVGDVVVDEQYVTIEDMTIDGTLNVSAANTVIQRVKITP